MYTFEMRILRPVPTYVKHASCATKELAARVISVSSAQVMFTYKFFITLDSLLEVLVISYGKVKPLVNSSQI